MLESRSPASTSTLEERGQMPGGIGGWEIAIVVFLAILIFGPKKLPELGSSLGRSISGFKRGLKETKDDVESAIKEDVTAGTETSPATAVQAAGPVGAESPVGTESGAAVPGPGGTAHTGVATGPVGGTSPADASGPAAVASTADSPSEVDTQANQS